MLELELEFELEFEIEFELELEFELKIASNAIDSGLMNSISLTEHIITESVILHYVINLTNNLAQILTYRREQY